MKRFFGSCGKAACYFAIFFGMQILVPIVYAMAMTFSTVSIQNTDPWMLLDALGQTILDTQIPALLLCNLLIIGIYLLTAPIRKRKIKHHLFLYAIPRQSILPLILLGFSLNLALNVLLAYIPFPEEWWQSYEAMSSFIPTDIAFVPMLAVSVVGPITEELCFRGLIYTRLKRGMGGVLAALVSSMVFGAVHGTMIWFCYAFPLGLLMVWLFHRFHSLWASIVFHIAFNLINFFLSYLPETPLMLLSYVGCAGSLVCLIWIARLSRK